MLRNVIFLLVLVAAVNCGRVVKSSGFKLEGRITGGESTAIEEHPYTVSVRITNFHLCGGSIVSDRVIVTAAHCVHPFLPPKIHSIQYATSSIGGINNVITAERTLRNENYNTTNYNNDIGLIFLISKIPFNAGAKPIQMSSQAPAIGVPAVVTGWGAMYDNGPRVSDLRKAVVNIIDRSDCQKQYKGINRITLSMLCAGVDKGGIDACKFDSGGPLVVGGQLAGIISFGYECGHPDYAGVYSNVAALKSWIDKNMTT